MWRALSLLVLVTSGESYVPENRAPTGRPPSGSPSSTGVKYSWTKPDFKYKDPSRRDDDIVSGHLIPENVALLDVDAYIGRNGIKREFVTVPNILSGSPFSLAEITKEVGEGGPLLKPFPNEHWHFRADCNSIISPFRIKIDQKGIMWVLDTGKIKTFVAPERLCGPQLLAFDLNNNDTLIKRYRIPADQLDPKSLMVQLEVENMEEDTYVYSCDPVTYRMIVYSMKKDASHPVLHPYFYPDALYGFYDLNGVNFTLMDGILSLALRKDNKNGGNKLYFHALSSGREGMVRTGVLKDTSRAVMSSDEFRISAQDRGYHVSVEVITKNGIMIFANLEDNALYAWDTKTEYTPRNFKTLVKNKETLQFVSGMKIVGDELYVVSTRLQYPIKTGAYPKDEVNFRVLVFNIDRLLSRQQGLRGTG